MTGKLDVLAVKGEELALAVKCMPVLAEAAKRLRACVASFKELSKTIMSKVRSKRRTAHMEVVAGRIVQSMLRIRLGLHSWRATFRSSLASRIFQNVAIRSLICGSLCLLMNGIFYRSNCQWRSMQWINGTTDCKCVQRCRCVHKWLELSRMRRKRCAILFDFFQ